MGKKGATRRMSQKEADAIKKRAAKFMAKSKGRIDDGPGFIRAYWNKIPKLRIEVNLSGTEVAMIIQALKGTRSKALIELRKGLEETLNRYEKTQW